MTFDCVYFFSCEKKLPLPVPCPLSLLRCSSFSYSFLIMFLILGKLTSAYFKYMCYELEMISCYLISNVGAIASLQLTIQTHLLWCVHLPLLGEPFNGQLVPEGGSQQEGEGKEGDEEKADVHGGAPEIFTSESAQTFPVRHPDRFSPHRPDNVVAPAPQTPRRSRDHNWKQLGTTECSTTCGKGELMCGLGGSLQIPEQEWGTCRYAPGTWQSFPCLSLTVRWLVSVRLCWGSPRPPSGSVIHRKDLENSENLLCSWLQFITVKGYRLASAKGKARVTKSRRHQAPASRCPLPVEWHRDALGSLNNIVCEPSIANQRRSLQLWCPGDLLGFNHIGM